MLEDTKESNECLKLIFNELNLNERANLRLVSKRFKELCDSIEIRRLVIFENAGRSAGRLVYTGEEYALVDTIFVGDLQKLFDNQPILQQMQSIETLVIHACYDSWETSEYELRGQFNELKHLELNNVNIVSPDIVAFSNKIECLQLTNVQLKPREFFDAKMKDYVAKLGQYFAKKDELCFVDDRGNSSPTFLFLSLEKVISDNLKYFSTNLAFDMSRFLIDCINCGIFESLEQLDLVAYDLEYLGHLIKKSPLLRVIHLKFYKLSVLFKQIISQSDWAGIVSQFRENLSVYLYNLLWNEQTSANLFRFLSDLNQIEMPDNSDVLGINGEGELNLIVNNAVYEHLSGRDEQHEDLVRRLLDVVDCLQTSIELVRKDEAFFKLFRNCVKINLDVSSPSIECLDAFPNLVTMRLEFEMIEYDEAILSPIEESCARVQNLVIILCNKVDTFDFLFELRCLRSVNLLLLYPIDQVAVIQLISELKYLQMLNVCFVRPSRMVKAELSAFRKLVNRTFSEKFKAKGLQFAVEIYTRKESEQFVRYLLDKADRIKTGSHKLTEFEENRMFCFVKEHKSEN